MNDITTTPIFGSKVIEVEDYIDLAIRLKLWQIIDRL